jgi:hypothetical protein
VKFPYTLAGNDTLECSYSTSLPDGSARVNTATVTTRGDVPGGSGTADVQFGAPSSQVDGCVAVSDNPYGGLGFACASDPNDPLPKTFSYSLQVGPYADPGQYTFTNVASFVGNAATGSDSWKVTVSVPGATQPLKVTKTAETSFTRTWNWTIDKSADRSQVTLATGQAIPVNYQVTVDATTSDSDWMVEGKITIYNPNPDTAATITGVADEISGPGNVAVVLNCGVTFPYQLAGNGTLECDYSASLPDGAERVNTATVTTSGDVPGGTDTADIQFGNPTRGVDPSIFVRDDLAGDLGTVIAPDAPKTFSYSLEVGPYTAYGQYTFTNVASFVAFNTGATGSDSWDVRVNVPAEGCTLTPGYWKTHSEYGPARFDARWEKLPNGADTLFFLSVQSYYQVLWTSPGGNAYYNLAHAYIAAELNALIAGGLPAEVQQAFDDATALFNTYTPDEIAALKGNQPPKKQFIKLAQILDQYNNGEIGPGHCSE